jgi:hypothetical protein
MSAHVVALPGENCARGSEGESADAGPAMAMNTPAVTNDNARSELRMSFMMNSLPPSPLPGLRYLHPSQPAEGVTHVPLPAIRANQPSVAHVASRDTL